MSDNGAVKRCSNCGETKPLAGYYRRSRSADGRQAECKVCAQKRGRERYADPTTGRAEKMRQWEMAHPDRVRENAARYYQANREKVDSAVKEWRASNRARVNELAQARYRANPEPHIARTARWLRENPERHAERQHQRRALTQSATSPEVLAAVIAELRQTPCAYCGSRERIEIDHIVPLSRGGKHEPGNLAPACKRCNTSKNNRLLDEWRPTVGPTSPVGP